MKPFEKHEKDLQDLLRLDSTSGSGSQWHDISDGTTRDQYDGSPFRLMIDGKSTIKGSYSVTRKFMASWVDQAETLGKRFALPIRFLNAPGDHSPPDDYIVLKLDDFVELLDIARTTWEKEK